MNPHRKAPLGSILSPPSRALTPNEEHARAIASAVSDLISAQNTRYADRDRVVEGQYKELVERITAALNSKSG